MLILIAAWILLGLGAMGLGWAFVRAHVVQGPFEWWLSAFGAIWFGLCLAGWIFFAVAIFVPLSGVALWVTWAGMGALALIHWRRAGATLRAKDIAGPSAFSLLVFAAFLLIFAERSTWIGNLNDTGGYHWNIVQWLNEFGVVPGIGLFQIRLATSSSWLALTAALNFGLLEERVLTVQNGLLFVVSIGLFAAATLRITRGGRLQSDWLVAAALLLLVPTMVRWEMRLSPSPDIPALIAPVIFVWYMMRAEEAPHRNGGIDAGLSLLVFSAVIVTVKVNALPLLVIAALAYAFGEYAKLSVARLVAGSSLGAAILSPLIATSLLTTGCLLFPSPVGCFDWPIGIGAKAAAAYTRIVRETAPWDIGEYLAASVAAAIALLPAWQRLTRAARWSIALAALSVAYLLVFAPTTRFGRGYLVLMPALAIAAHRDWIINIVGRAARRAPLIFRSAGVVVVLMVFAAQLYKGFSTGRVRVDPAVNAPNAVRFVWPSRLQYNEDFGAGRTDGFEYATSKKGTCWNHPLPCAGNFGWPYMSDFRLRDPLAGPGAGFVRR